MRGIVGYELCLETVSPMRAYDAIRLTLDASMLVLTEYLSDFTDADLMKRPAPGANHPAWQLGHLITSEFDMMEAIKPGVSPRLPAGFREQHAPEQSACDEPGRFLSKELYLSLYRQQRRATLSILEMLTEEALNESAPLPFREWASTVGALINAAGTHLMMHTGQFAVLRRKLGKPIKI